MRFLVIPRSLRFRTTGQRNIAGRALVVKWTARVLVAVTTWGLGARGGASAQGLFTVPDYVSVFRRSLEPSRDRDKFGRLISRQKPGRLAARAELYLRVGRALNSAAHRAEGRVYLDALVALLEAQPGELWRDFHVVTPAARAVGLAKALGIWSEQDDQSVRLAVRRAVRAYVDGPDRTHGNRDVSRVAGIATILRFFVAEPAEAELWHQARERVRKFLDRLLALGDLDENAGSYSSLGLLRFLHALRATGREKEWLTPAWLRVFDRYRLLVSPGGRMPEWGDDYFKVEPPLHWIYLFEYAAVRWGKPEFARTARRMFAVRGPEARSEEADLARAAGLLELEPIELEGDEGAAKREQASRITDRVTADGRRVLDKLVLRPSRESGGPMVMVDLYCRGDHTHLDKLGAITFYETGGVPHFTNYGRYRQSAAHANLVLATAPGVEFPPGGWVAETWRTQSLPTDRLPRVSGHPTNRKLGRLSFRNHPNQASTKLWVDNLRLVGPNGVRPLDWFAKGNWTPMSHCFREALGTRAGVLGLDLAKVLYQGPRESVVFDPADYGLLHYDVRYGGDRPPKVQARFPGGYDSWHFVGQTTLLARLDTARVETAVNSPRDEPMQPARARFRLSPYLSWDSHLERSLALFPNGVLVIRDDLHAGPSLDQHRAGVLWQMYSVGERGDRWFHAPSTGASRALSPAGVVTAQRDHLVHFSVAPTGSQEASRQFGVRTIPHGKGGSTIGGSRDLFSSHASLRISGGSSATFVTVVVPFKTGTDPVSVARGVEVRFKRGDAHVRVGSIATRMVGE